MALLNASHSTSMGSWNPRQPIFSPNAADVPIIVSWVAVKIVLKTTTKSEREACQSSHEDIQWAQHFWNRQVP